MHVEQATSNDRDGVSEASNKTAARQPDCEHHMGFWPAWHDHLNTLVAHLWLPEDDEEFGTLPRAPTCSREPQNVW